jgi:hypothetical protein
MNDRYYLWGAGSVGKRALGYLAPLGILDGIIDSDRSKWGQTVDGLEIVDYDALKLSMENTGVIIAFFGSEKVEDNLERDGIKYWKLSNFLTEWFWVNRQQNAVGFLDFPITTHCSLECKDCMQYIPLRSKFDVSLDALKQDLETLFSCVSFIGEISIIGGEPLLHENLPGLLEHIGENYRERIGSLVITTNGTIIPDIRTLELCREVGIFISVSDYSDSIPCVRDGLIKLEAAARNAGVCIERKCWNWVAPGMFDTINDDGGNNDCAQTHMQLADGKLWRCTLMAAGYFAGLCPAGSGLDYYDLSQSNNAVLHNFFYDKSKSGRTSQCIKCSYEKKIGISSAVQVDTYST